MKTLQIFFVIMFCAMPLYADQALVLTEIEQIQERIWHLQRTVAAQKTSIDAQQKQLGLIASKADSGRLELSERLTALTESTSGQKDATRQLEIEIGSLNQALALLTNEVRQKDSSVVEQAGRTGALEGSLQELRAEFAALQTSTAQELAETRRQLDETRAQLDAMGQDVGGRIEQIGLWGGGAALILAIVLTVVAIGRKSRPKKHSPDRKLPPKHEM
ncbi:MAG: hypothetical protein OEL80_01585 [Desulfuromonadales bacterium]|nr:hypothetical protein [Desulfuromonadales bacterium]